MQNPFSRVKKGGLEGFFVSGHPLVYIHKVLVRWLLHICYRRERNSEYNLMLKEGSWEARNSESI